MTSFNAYREINEQLAERISNSILYFARETPEVWLRQYLTTDVESRPFEDQKFPYFGFDLYKKMRDFIYNFVNEGKEMRVLILYLIQHLPLDEEEWDEQFKVIQVDDLKYFETFYK